MATEVYTTEEIILSDGAEVELRPLPISKLKKFMKIWHEHLKFIKSKIGSADPEDADAVFNDYEIIERQLDVLIKLCVLGLEGQLKGDMSNNQFISYLEETLDEQTIHKIVEVTGGLNLGTNPDPNLMPPV